MKIWSNNFSDGDVIPRAHAFCVADVQTHVALGANRNPHLAWHDIPAGTHSLALICHDPDVPSRGDDVNQEGRSVPATLPRVDFFHWILIDLPPGLAEIMEGECSNQVTPRGKPGPATGIARLGNARHGLNDYTGWFAQDAQMCGDYCGYDGPCPPWNDELPHRYVFTLYALDVARLPLDGKFTGAQVRAAMAGHILDEARLMVRYTLNPRVSL